jgi:hypothetical protein
MVWALTAWSPKEGRLGAIKNIECSTKKNDVRLQITPCCSTIVQVCAPNVLPICEQTDLISAVSALLSDDTESLD